MLIAEDDRPVLADFTRSTFAGASSGEPVPFDGTSEINDIWDFGIMILVTFAVNTLVTFYLTIVLVDVVYASGVSDPTSPTFAARPSECEGDFLTYDRSLVGHMFRKLGSQPHLPHNTSHHGKNYKEGTLFSVLPDIMIDLRRKLLERTKRSLIHQNHWHLTKGIRKLCNQTSCTMLNVRFGHFAIVD